MGGPASPAAEQRRRYRRRDHERAGNRPDGRGEQLHLAAWRPGCAARAKRTQRTRGHEVCLTGRIMSRKNGRSASALRLSMMTCDPTIIAVLLKIGIPSAPALLLLSYARQPISTAAASDGFGNISILSPIGRVS